MAVCQLQIISKIIATGSISILEDNLLTKEYFVGYEDVYDFITEHYEKYHQVPDKATIIGKFNDIELIEVTESDKYLVDTIREEHLYTKTIPVIKESAKLLKSDSNAAVEYLMNAIKNLQPEYRIGGTDIISQAEERYSQYQDRKNHQDDWYFTTGFEELDELFHGIQREEELFVIYARTNNAKSWVLENICKHVWEIGFNVGYLSPEMSANSIGYRFDTLYKNFSNKGLMWGKSDIDEDTYKNYIDNLKQHEGKFIVSTPNDFNRNITVTKLRKYIQQYKLDLLAIDGITYLSDERYKRGDNKTTSLTNISEDLMSLSMELHVPILVVVQANRGGVVDKDKEETPELENIRDSDGISHNASKVLAVRLKDNVLILEIKKSRFGKVGGKLKYSADLDAGIFEYLPSSDDVALERKRNDNIVNITSKLKNNSDVF